jgi:hypothetical protein
MSYFLAPHSAMSEVLRARARGGRSPVPPGDPLPWSPEVKALEAARGLDHLPLPDLAEQNIRELEPEVPATLGIRENQRERRHGAKSETRRKYRQRKKKAEASGPLMVVRKQPLAAEPSSDDAATSTEKEQTA